MTGSDPVDEVVSAAPNGPLRTIVACYTGYRQQGLAPARHLGLPSPYLTTIFTIDQPLLLARQNQQTRSTERHANLVSGLHTSPVTVMHDGSQSGIHLQVNPLLARPLFGVPAGELARLDIPAEDLLGPLAARICDQIRDVDRWHARFKVLDRLLGETVTPTRTAAAGAPAEVAHAWQCLLASGGTQRISDIARRLGWSSRHLSAQFTREIGMNPKTAARVVRFDRAQQKLQHQARAGRTDVAGIATDCGYFDQAHLIRDWREFTGLAPTEWVRHEFRNFQEDRDRQEPSSLP